MSQSEDLTVTREDVARWRNTPADIAEAMRLYDARRREEAATQSAQERLVMGAFGSWIKHRWKTVTVVSGILATLVAGGLRAWQEVKTKAEEQVLERQAAEKQAAAVEQTSAAFGDVTRKQDELGLRVEKVEAKVSTQSQITEILLELHLRDPKTKRIIDNDKKLKAKIDQIPGVQIDD